MLDRSKSVLAAMEVMVAAQPDDAALSSFLAQHLAVVLYAEIEETVAKIIQDKLASHMNSELAEFLTVNMAGIIKRTPKSDINSLVKQFGAAVANRFNGELDDRLISFYGNAISARHDVGHRRGSNVTLPEMKTGISAAERILSALRNCLA